jgi:hypothetical protein
MWQPLLKPLLFFFPTAPPLHRRSSRSESFPMPLRRSSSGHCGVHVRPTGSFYDEICATDYSLPLRTFETAHKAHMPTTRRRGAVAQP